MRKIVGLFKGKIIALVGKSSFFAISFEKYFEYKFVHNLRKKFQKTNINLNNSFLIKHIDNIEIKENVIIGAYNVFCVVETAAAGATCERHGPFGQQPYYAQGRYY